jgi:hypothetical protein
MDKPGLPVARLRPRDAGEQLVVLAAQAKDGARRVGAFAAVTTKAVAMLALCGAGVYLVGSSHPGRTHGGDIDQQLRSIEQTRHYSFDLRTPDFPKIDLTKYDFSSRHVPDYDLSKLTAHDFGFDYAPLAHHDIRPAPPPAPDPTLTPSQRAATSSP